MYKMKISVFVALLCTIVIAQTQDNGLTADYYQSAYKLSGTALKTALHNLTKGHTQVSYSSLYTHYKVTDNRNTNKVWDMYSDKPGGTPAYEYTHGSLTCGSYNGEGDCYNREHSWPQSWFDGASMPSSDLFNVYPTDGYVNNRRGNLPYGDVSSATWTSTNGSKVGSSKSPGYSGTVFEPIDAYKGDFARSHFYMSVRYYTEDGSWATSPGTNKSELLTWYANMLYNWSIKDTVSTKEINRNEAVYGIQKKRNPFIDHPEFIAEVWMTSMAPKIDKFTVVNSSEIVIDFSRYIDSATAVNPANYVFDNNLGNPISVEWGINNDVSKVKLTTVPMSGSKGYTLQLKNYKSINSVSMNDTTVSFISPAVTAIDVNSVVASNYYIDNNYPNPFNPATIIKYNLGAQSNVKVTVYNSLGENIKELVNGIQNSGSNEVRFNAEGLSSGIYMYQVQAQSLDGKHNFNATRKMILVK